MSRFATSCALFLTLLPFASTGKVAGDFLLRYYGESSPGQLAPNEWSCWSDISNLMVFGASYAYTRSLSPHSPFNTPAPPFDNSCAGPNYVEALATKYNKSLLTTQMLAYPGAPASGMASSGHENGVDFGHQVAAFLNKQEQIPSWTRNNTLFHVEFGINDIEASYSSFGTKNPDIFHEYLHDLNTLYDHGARNFLLLNIPPLDIGPYVLSQDEKTRSAWRDDIADFNHRLDSTVEGLVESHSDATIFFYNTNSLFKKVLANPSMSTQTSVYKTDALKTFCQGYSLNSNTLPSPIYKNASCQYAVNEYFWLNGFHPTWPVHDLMGESIGWGLANL